MLRDADDPVVQERLADLVRISQAHIVVWADESITDRVKVARLRLLLREGAEKLAALIAYCKETNDWVEEDDATWIESQPRFEP